MLLTKLKLITQTTSTTNCLIFSTKANVIPISEDDRGLFVHFDIANLQVSSDLANLAANRLNLIDQFEGNATYIFALWREVVSESRYYETFMSYTTRFDSYRSYFLGTMFQNGSKIYLQ